MIKRYQLQTIIIHFNGRDHLLLSGHWSDLLGIKNFGNIPERRHFLSFFKFQIFFDVQYVRVLTFLTTSPQPGYLDVLHNSSVSYPNSKTWERQMKLQEKRSEQEYVSHLKESI